jgi:predicted ArsR family transcriptional regulator
MLLREIATEEGNAGFDRIMARISERMAQQYAIVVNASELAQRLDELRAAMEQQGIPAASDDDSIAIFACPYYAIIHDHPGVCVMERRMVEQLVGEPIALQNSIRDGHHSCQFVVQGGATPSGETIPLLP